MAAEFPERIRFLDAFRGYAILMVVGMHAFEYAGLPPDMKGKLSFWIQTAAVPPFFMVDGYLFMRTLGRTPEFSYVDYLGKSARRLLVPWLGFSCVYAILRGIFEYTTHPSVQVIVGHGTGGVLRAVYYSSIAAQMYFLLSLFLIRTMSFVTKKIAAVPSPGLLAGFVGYAGLWQWLHTGEAIGDLDPVVHAFWGFQFYLLGMVLYRCRTVVSEHLALGGLLAWLGVVAVQWFDAPHILGQYGYLLGLLSVFLVSEPWEFIFYRIGRETMGIYLFHAPIMLKAESLVGSLIGARGTLWLYVVMTIGGVALSMLATEYVRRTSWGAILLGEPSTGRVPTAGGGAALMTNRSLSGS